MPSFQRRFPGAATPLCDGNRAFDLHRFTAQKAGQTPRLAARVAHEKVPKRCDRVHNSETEIAN